MHTDINLVLVVAANGRTFGYLKNWVPDGYWNRYTGTHFSNHFADANTAI